MSEIQCGECQTPIKSDEDEPYCAKCGAPPDCDSCGEVMLQGICNSGSKCHQAAIEKATETITLVKCNECEKAIAPGRGVCSRCSSQEISAAKACSVGRYPFQGIVRTGELQDRILSFLAVLAETCGCVHSSKRCIRCLDAVELHAAYTHQLGEIRT